MKKYLILSLSLFVSFYTYAANDKAFVWEVSSAADSSNQVTVYLMGSIHFADKSFYPLRAEIEEAFKRSKYLVVELDIRQAEHDVYSQMLAQKGIYTDGTTIKDVISEETWLQLRQRLQHLNIAYDAVKYYKPGVLVLTLSTAQVMKMGFDPQLGIDAYFLAKASRPQQVKQVIELETLEQQLDLFINIPNGDLLLKESLYSLDESELLMADLVRFWKQGDVAQMNKLLFEDALDEYPAFGEIYDKLFYERNRNMVLKIDAMLQRDVVQREYYFVVIGSGHLIGDNGIVNALQQKGYKVRRL